MPTPSAIETLAQWAEPQPGMGPAVFRLTQGPGEYKHAYHIYCPWSADGQSLLLARYNRTDPEAAICLLDTATGESRIIDESLRWNSHTAAHQQWLGQGERLLFESADEENRPTLVAVNRDGSERRVYPADRLQAVTGSPDGRYVYAGMPFDQMFAEDDSLLSRHDRGLLRLDMATGEETVLLSIEDAFALLPKGEATPTTHLYAKMVVHHPKLPRVLFNLTNTLFDRDGTEPRVRCLISLGPHGEEPAFVGRVLHHPNWHPIEDRIIGNILDFNDRVRFGIYPGGGGLVQTVPNTEGSGHPTISPRGDIICTDGGRPDGRSWVRFFDPMTGHAIPGAIYQAVSGGYRSFKALDARTSGTVMQTINRLHGSATETWQSQAHPSWSRDGSAVIFNRDDGTGSQVYAIDVARALQQEPA